LHKKQQGRDITPKMQQQPKRATKGDKMDTSKNIGQSLKIKTEAHESRTILTVDGDATIEVVPDKALVTITVTTQSRIDDKEREFNEHAADVKLVKEYFSRDSPNIVIKRESVSTYPVYERDQKKPPAIVAVRYITKLYVRFRTPALKQLTHLHNISLMKRVTIDDVSFGLTNKNNAKTRALFKATRNALSIGMNMAESIGFRVSEIATVTQESAYAGQVMARSAPMRMEAAPGRMQEQTFSMEPGVIKVSGSVKMTMFIDPFKHYTRSGREK